MLDNAIVRVLVVLAVASASAHAGDFTVTVKPASKTFHLGQPVEVKLTVTNWSKSTLPFTTMSCSWSDDWSSTDPDLAIEPRACDRDGPQKIMLYPHKSRSWTLTITPAATAKLGAHHLGFTFHPKSYDDSKGSTKVTIEK